MQCLTEQIAELMLNMPSSSRTITEEEISKKISDGVTKLLIIDNVVYDVTNYLNRLFLPNAFPENHTIDSSKNTYSLINQKR